MLLTLFSYKSFDTRKVKKTIKHFFLVSIPLVFTTHYTQSHLGEVRWQMVQEVEVITQRFPFATPHFLAIFLCGSLLLAAPLHQCGSSMGYSPSEVFLLQHAEMTQGSSRSYPIDNTLHPLLLKPCLWCPRS